MQLHVERFGSGPRTCVLLHGMMGSLESWWRVNARLVDAGYRVLAIDLPGHGLSGRDRGLTVERAAASVVSTVAAITDQNPAVAIGHSFGGMILAAAASQLNPELAIYVDAPLSSRGGQDFTTAAKQYEKDRQQRTLPNLRALRPYYSAKDCEVEALAAKRFDPLTAAAVASAGGGKWDPMAGSIMVRPVPSNYVSDDAVKELMAHGVIVRDIPGAAHSAWYSHFDGFIASLPEIFTPQVL